MQVRSALRCRRILSDCRLTSCPVLLRCPPVELADCYFAELFAQQELLIKRLQPSALASDGSELPTALELLSTVVNTGCHSLSVEALLSPCSSKDQAPSGADRDADDSTGFTLPPNPLALLLATVFP